MQRALAVGRVLLAARFLFFAGRDLGAGGGVPLAKRRGGAPEEGPPAYGLRWYCACLASLSPRGCGRCGGRVGEARGGGEAFSYLVRFPGAL